jgi:hypothetical protein
MRCRFLPLLAAGVVLVVSAGSSAAGPDARPGKTTFASGLGTSLPNHNGKVLASVECDGSSVNSACQGIMQLIPRGPTRALLGTKPVAARYFKVRDGDDGDRLLALKRPARAVLAKEPLRLTFRLKPKGRPAKTRPVVVALARPVKRGAVLDKVAITRSKAGVTTYTRNWSWDIKWGTFLKLPDWRCPSATPRVARSGSSSWGGEGKLDARAGEGTGYSGFDHAHTAFFINANFYNWFSMNGWPEGGWFYNSVWAPAFKNGHFELTVTCTDAAEFDAAYTNQGNDERFFPWKN